VCCGPSHLDNPNSANCKAVLDYVKDLVDVVGHNCGHTKAYHRWVYKQLSDALEGKTGKAARDAFVRALEEIRAALEANPRLPYRDGGL
jgi:hypothetical protein